ncbi:tail fiber assembly protein [Providencia sp. wls1950]|uniref:tail fiber assembly protein n=1 Tax=Providencia sp. wls1950 TaxID=2675147 RepID=UPI0012B55A38|nr:hypothetical protein [Providencia sp. wls1950]
METIKLYHYDNFTGEFQNITEPYKGSEIPKFSTEEKPLKDKAGYACIFKNGTWTYIEDHRGYQYYSTLNASQLIINELGPLPAHITDIKPNHWDDVWDGTKWMLKPPPSNEELIFQTEQRKQALLSDATIAIAPLQDAVDLGIATEKEREELRAWKEYRVEVNRVDVGLGLGINWPVSPK